MSPPFEVAGGTVPGGSHVLAGRNNQDAFAWARTPAGLVAVVCDGCGSSPHSEVGANLGARFIVHSALGLLATAGPDVDHVSLLTRVRADVVAQLRTLATLMSVDSAPRGAHPGPGLATGYERTVLDHFLFTVIGVIVDEHFATTFALGDGLIVVNGERRALGPFPNNEPPYIGYGLLERSGLPREFEVHRSIPQVELHSLLLGTDGVFDLERVVGAPEPHEPALAQFWKDDRFFRNQDMVRRRLTVLGRGPRGGTLADDTTLVVLRRNDLNARPS